MQKNISQDTKSKQFAQILKENIEINQSKINNARVHLMSMVIIALCKVQTVNFYKLALAFDCQAKPDSALRRLQRFIADFELCKDLIARLIFSLLPEKTGLKLVLDRTNWQFGSKDINILMLGVAYRGVAFPLMFSLLDKKGNSNCQERIGLINRFIGLFGKECVDYITADREFVGEQWIGFLNNLNLRYYIRIRNNFKVFL